MTYRGYNGVSIADVFLDLPQLLLRSQCVLVLIHNLMMTIIISIPYSCEWVAW